MTKRNIDLTNRAIIVELNKEGYTTAFIKQIIQSDMKLLCQKVVFKKLLRNMTQLNCIRIRNAVVDQLNYLNVLGG